jgi:hypothetical protein
VDYRLLYANERLQNINGNGYPKQPEAFLDESYCHLDHHTYLTWAPSHGIVNESGRKPMLVIFSAFIVYKNGRKRRASMTEDSMPVNKSKDMNPDYHGRFTAEEFEQLFENLCKFLIHYGNCIIHIDGASYHKHRINPGPNSADRKDKIVE